MKRIICDIKSEKSLADAAEEAAKVLQRRGIVVYPTDTAYGLGGNAIDNEVIRKIFAIKGRSEAKPLSIAIKNIDMIDRYAALSSVAERFLEKIWPGPVTVVLQKRSTLPDALTGGEVTIGLRMPRHPFCEALFKYIDFPITATSANVSGKGSLYDPQSVADQFKKRGHKPDLLIDAGILQDVPPSTIIDLAGAKPKILRIGPVRPDELLALFNTLS
ncbi:MAG: L-threonylcarbamoyladenylate synthase [bacterium]|nr:L-threonylcarbamoyladenylate synthase [bacterium]